MGGMGSLVRGWRFIVLLRPAEVIAFCHGDGDNGDGGS